MAAEYDEAQIATASSSGKARLCIDDTTQKPEHVQLSTPLPDDVEAVDALVQGSLSDAKDQLNQTLRSKVGWDAIQWKRDGQATWKILPSESIIRSICAAIAKVPVEQVVVKRIVPSHPHFTDYEIQGLGHEIPGFEQDDRPDVQYQGGRRRRLDFRAHLRRRRFIFRAYLPRVPKMLTLSAVATMRYVREHTKLDIEVPEVIAFCADAAKTELKFEYVLMRYPPGVTIDEALPSSNRFLRRRLAYDIAQTVRNCESDPAFYFDKIGSLYESDLDRHKGQATTPSSFSMGYVNCHNFTNEKLSYMSRPGNEFGINAGPFDSAYDFQNAVGDCCMKFLAEGLELWFGEDLAEFDQGYLEDRDSYQLVCRDALEKLHLWKDRYDQKSFYLERRSFANTDILVDPVTFQITGLLNWEQTYTVPDFMRKSNYDYVRGLTYFTWFYIRDGDPSYMKFGKRKEYMKEIAHWINEGFESNNRPDAQGENELDDLWVEFLTLLG